MAERAFVSIPGGWFQMGSAEGKDDERPVHSVWVDEFALAAYPVTSLEYAAFLAATGHEQPRDWHPEAASADHPVIGVSWIDCQRYCDWRTSVGEPVRLPTEAEWERAARGGHERRRYPWGDDIPSWIPANGRGPLDAPWPVTLGEPNGFGVFGIAANIHEWCADWHAADYYGQSSERNPAGPAKRRAPRLARRLLASCRDDQHVRCAQPPRSVVPVYRLRLPGRALSAIGTASPSPPTAQECESA